MQGILEVWREEDHRGNAVMTVHVLHAGDGYVYLTRQVASDDVARSSGDRLVDYYQAAGNPPGVWVGSGCRDLGMSGDVTEEHMLALFGEGLRPDANEFIADRVAAGDSFDAALKSARLGRKFYEFTNSIPLVDDLRVAYTEFQKAHGRRASVAERRDIKERVAQARWATDHPNEPTLSKQQLHQYLVDQLGRARQPVAGFDLVFSMVKSAKIMWALGGRRIRRVLERIHNWALRATLAYGEREAGFTRVGTNGIAFKKVFGFVATAFLHRDSRAGDPDLHTHVAISNRVLADDGVWRTIDSRQLHKIAVSMSEMYNTLVEWALTDELGVRWTEVDQGPGKRSIREIAGIPIQWIKGFSQRRTQVEDGYERLVADYVRQHGHPPSRSVQYDLAQQATLENRPEKGELRTLAEQIEDWTRRAAEMLPGVDIPATIQACLQHAEPRVGPDLEQIAASVVARISEERATWAVYHVRAEVHRQLRPHAGFFTSDRELLRAVETVTRVALDRRSILLDVEVEDLPQMLRHPDTPPRPQHEHPTDQHDEQPDRDRVDPLAPGLEGHLGWAGESDAGAEESVFRRRGSRTYTSEAILAAEQRLVDDARVTRGAVVPDEVRDAAILRWQQDTGKTLNPGQRALVAHFVSSGRALAVGIGPPGTGKSTTMAAMRAAWETTGGRVIGFAPSAAAASVLSDDLGVRADTLHSLIVARRHGATVDVKPGDLLLVDEAGMAGTLLLDEVRALAAERGAVVRLLGDYRQLSAVEAGGVLRLLHHDVGGVELNQVHRFARPDEARAVLQLRVGNQAAVDWYVDNDRLVCGVGPAVLDTLYRDWKTDVDVGRTAIMISDSTDIARELSARAQTERRAAGLVEPDGVRLHDGTIAGVGDLVVTRLNRRNLVLFGGKDFVKNGDLWEVIERYADGRLTVRHVRHGGEVRLSAAYVARFVELGYAATITRSQGLTVEICRAFLTAMAAREAALVALSRGTHGNVAYFDTQQVLHVDEPPILPGDLFYRYRETSVAAQALRAILEREAAELSATEQVRNALDEPRRLSTLVPLYGYARQLHRGPAGMGEAEDWVRAALPRYAEDVLSDEAWPELARVLHEVRDAGVEPVGLLRTRAAERALTDDSSYPAQSVAQVLHWRITEQMPLPGTGPHPDRPELLPGWVPTPPHPEDDLHIPGSLEEIVELGTWLRGRADLIATRVRELGERLAHQVTHRTVAPRTGQAPQDGASSARLHTPEPAPEHAIGPPPDWVIHLGQVPEDPMVREQWIRRAGHVAAYRERWQIPDIDPELLPDGRGERGRARAWVLAYLHDHPLHRAAADAAERAARERKDWDQHVDRAADRLRRREHEDQERERRRVEMAALFRETWRHEPDLVAIILTAAAFDTVAARLDEAADAGYHLHAVLAELPLDTLRDAHIHDPAAYTAALIDIAVDRIRTGQADHDADRRAEQERFAQMLDQAADLLREAWAARPHLAEAVIHAPAFPALVRALDRYATAGLDARDLLAAVALAKLDVATVIHVDRYAVYLVHRIARRQLDALDQAHATAREHAERLATQRHAATLLRRAWHHHPAQAEQVIGGPAFRHLADRMLAAHQQGHDLHAILRGLDPDALTAPHVPSPSGTVTFAFSRAVQAAARQAPEHASMATAAPNTDRRQVNPAPVEGASRGPTAVPPRPDHLRAAVAPRWSRRPYGSLTDAALRIRISEVQRATDRLAHEHETTVTQADQLRLAAEAGQGQYVQRLDDQRARLQHLADVVHDIDQLETQWLEARERAGHAAEQRAHAQHELDQLGRLARTRRTELTHRIDQLRHAEDLAHRHVADLAHRAAELQQQTGPKEQRQRIQERLHHLETGYAQDRATAMDLDRTAARSVRHRADRLLEQHDLRRRELNDLRAEQQARDLLTEAQQRLEEQERLTAHTPDIHRAPAGPTVPGVEVTRPQLVQSELTNTELVTPELDNPVLGSAVTRHLEPPPSPPPQPEPEP